MRFDWAVRRLVSGVVPEGGILKVVHPRPGMQQRGGEEKRRRRKRKGVEKTYRPDGELAQPRLLECRGWGGPFTRYCLHSSRYYALSPPCSLTHSLTLSLSLAHMPLRPVGVCIQETGIICAAS